VTETGWPISGPSQGSAMCSIGNSETHFHATVCADPSGVDALWYIETDPHQNPPEVDLTWSAFDVSGNPLFNVQC
jgi:glucan endo-1,3-beta-D-glucosidase